MQTSISSPAVCPDKPTASPSTSSTEAAVSTSTPAEPTSEQPTVTQSEVRSSTLPIDLSTKKSPEAESAAPSVAPIQGIHHVYFGFLNNFFSFMLITVGNSKRIKLASVYPARNYVMHFFC